MTSGKLVVDRVSQRFRISERPYRTLKDAVVRRNRSSTHEIWALRDVSFEVDPGEALALVGRNGSGKTTLLRVLSGIFKPTSGRIAVAGRVGSLLELGAGFHQDFTGRENVYLNGSIHGLSRATIRQAMDEIVAFAELEQFIDNPVRTYSSGMYMRLGFSVAAHIQADVLLLDEVFAVGDEAFQRKCFGKINEFKNRGGTIVFVSHDAEAVERLCDRAVLLRQGSVEFDGQTLDALTEYRRLLAGDQRPAELAAGLREWGSGGARIVSTRMLDATGEERPAFASGEPATIELVTVTESGIAPPLVSLELRDDSGTVLAGLTQATAEIGFGEGAGERVLRFEIPRLPLADGHFHLRCALVEREGGRLLHSLDEAADFFVFPSGAEKGAVLLEGSWAVQEISAPAPIP